VAELPEVIGLLHRADWTRLSLSAEVRFESGRAALLIAPGGHYRMERQDEDAVVQGNDGQRGWTWWPSGRSEPSAAEVGPRRRPAGRPCSSARRTCSNGYVLEILGPVTACGRAAIAIAATPRAGDRLPRTGRGRRRRRAGYPAPPRGYVPGPPARRHRADGRDGEPAAAPDPAGFRRRRAALREAPGGAVCSAPDEGSKAKNVVIDLAAGGLGAVIKHAPRLPGRDADSGQAEAPMPSPDPDVLAAEDGSPPDDLLYSLTAPANPAILERHGARVASTWP
jgi:hypothetical protein